MNYSNDNPEVIEFGREPEVSARLNEVERGYNGLLKHLDEIRRGAQEESSPKIPKTKPAAAEVVSLDRAEKRSQPNDQTRVDQARQEIESAFKAAA